MHRRQVLTTFGAGALGLVAADATSAGHGPEQMPADGPLAQMHLYLCAFHIAKRDPQRFFEAHHYCMPVNDEVHQCVIFDTNGKGARILGVEYIISDKLYRSLPDAEKKYYHPHAYEVTSGLLIAPDMKTSEENKFMEGLVGTWGKTWHTWPDPKTSLPLGEPLLMWSATKDGQIQDEVLTERDKRFQVSTSGIRERRAYIGPVPQVEPPQSVDDIGRRWTNTGPDQPKRD